MIVSIVVLVAIAMLAVYTVGYRHGVEASERPRRRVGDWK